MTVKTLWKLCSEQIGKGNGDKEIILSDDDEGNGGHIMYYGFTENVANAFLYYPIDEKDFPRYIVLG